MRRALWSCVLAVAAVLATLVVATPAQAADSGGGCRQGTVVGPCISRTGGYLNADFYLNSYGTCTLTSYQMNVIVNNNVYWNSGLVRFTGTGRYPRYPMSAPVKVHVAGSTLRKQTAYTRVYVYDCRGVFQFGYNSPTLYFVA